MPNLTPLLLPVTAALLFCLWEVYSSNTPNHHLYFIFSLFQDPDETMVEEDIRSESASAVTECDYKVKTEQIE